MLIKWFAISVIFVAGSASSNLILPDFWGAWGALFLVLIWYLYTRLEIKNWGLSVQDYFAVEIITTVPVLTHILFLLSK